MTETTEKQESEKTAAEEPIKNAKISEQILNIADDIGVKPNTEELSQSAEIESEAGDASQPDEEILTPEKEIADLKDRLLRALADVENTRRRSTRDNEETRKYAASGFAKDLLNVSDNLRRALETVGDELGKSDDVVKNLVLGIEMVEKELLMAFERQGISKIDPLGEPFDHKFHQAMYEKPDTGFANGIVVEVMQAGYTMHDRLLRPAMVAVAKETSEDLDAVDTTA